MNISKKYTIITGSVIYIVISLAIIFDNHHYYDDEVYNLSKLHMSFSELMLILQTSDVHPPGSLILNKIIYNFFGSYKAILVFSLVFNVAALIYCYTFLEGQLADIYSKLLLFIFVFLNGGILLWTNSVRWYTYWVPLFIIFYTYLLKKQKFFIKDFIAIGLLLSFMTYINYLTFLLLASFSVYLFVSRRRDVNTKNIASLFFIYFILCSYQLYIFFTIHIYQKDGQTSGFIRASLNAIYGIINGGSIFIADPVFLFFSFFSLIIIILGSKTIFFNKKIVNPLVIQSIILFFGMLSLMALSGVSGKYRNNIALSIPFWFIISYLFAHIKNINVKRCYLISALILSIVSTYNLVTRHDTAKKSYNMPIAQLSDFLKGQNNKNKLIFTHDPVINFHFTNQKYNVHNLYNKQYDNIVIEKGTFVYNIMTYQGSLPGKQYEKVLSLYNRMENCMKEVREEKIGIDKYYKVKNTIGGSLPEMGQYQMEISFGEMRDVCMLPVSLFPFIADDTKN